MSALEWYEATRLDGTKGIAANSDHGVRFFVGRHGEGRKYWGVTYPDSTYTHNALTQAEAKLQAESWEPDSELVQLLDDAEISESGAADVMPAAAVKSGPTDVVELVDALVVEVRSRPVENRGRGWGYQDAGQTQREALAAIAELAQLRAAVDRAITAQVAVARTSTGSAWYSNAATWAHIGEALGVTKQSAQAKYGKAV